MSENLPNERPDFEPPDPSWVWPGGSAPQAAVSNPPVVPSSPQVAVPPPVAPGWHPGYPPPAAAPPPPVFATHPDAAILPPGPYKQPWPLPPQPAAPEREVRGSFLFGMGISLVTLGMAWWITVGLGYGAPPAGIANGALSISTGLLIVLGIVLVVIPRTMRTGAGVLVGFIVSMFVAGAVWVFFVLGAVS